MTWQQRDYSERGLSRSVGVVRMLGNMNHWRACLSTRSVDAPVAVIRHESAVIPVAPDVAASKRGN